jgi:hypothetical protein
MEAKALRQIEQAGVSLSHPATDSLAALVRPKVWDDLIRRVPGIATRLETLTRDSVAIDQGVR